MISKPLLGLIAFALLLLTTPTFAAEAPGDPKADFQALFSKIQGKLRGGERSEEALSAELKEFDALLAKYKGQKTDDVANILFMKAMLHAQIFQNSDEAAKILGELKKQFPETKQGKDADRLIAAMKAQAEGEKIKKSLVVGKPFPDFEGEDLAGKAFSLKDYKGKVVLIDFWATWCGPCVRELPHVKETYSHHHSKGFEVIGVSLDRDRGKLEDFVKKEQMTWRQHYDEGGVLATKYGVASIPTTYLLDGKGNIIAANLRGAALEKAVKQALGN